MAKIYCIMGRDECGDDFHIEDVQVPELEGFEPEEVADLILSKKDDELRERYPEAQSFWTERKISDMSYSELRAMASWFD